MKKKLFKLFLVLFLFANVIAFFHAYKFTHFTKTDVVRTDGNAKLGFGQKVKLACFGVDNPHPINTKVPDRPYETVYIDSDVKLETWYIKTDSLQEGTVIIFHGYAGKKSDMLDRAYIFLEYGYNVLLVDFKGSGGSEGNSTNIGYKESKEVRSCYDYIAKHGEGKIFLYGTSMGAAAILKCMNDYKMHPLAIMLECPFGSMYKTVCARFKMMHFPAFPMAGVLMFWGSVQNGFWAFGHNPAEYAKKVDCHTLLMYGEKDDRVSKEETDEIYNNIRFNKKLATYPESGHENYRLKYDKKWETDVFTFLSEVDRFYDYDVNTNSSDR